MDPRIRKRLLLAGAAAAVVLIVAAIVLINQANEIIKHRLEQALGENFAVESLSLGWNRVEVNQPRFMKDGRITAQARRIVLKPEILSLLKPGLSISRVILEELSLSLEIDRDGRWVLPVEMGSRQQAPSDSKPGPVSFRRIEVEGGTLVLQDHRRSEPNRLELRKIRLKLERIRFPLGEEPSPFDIRTELAGSLLSGSVSGSGTIRFDTLAASGRFEGQNLVFLDGGKDGPVSRVPSMSVTASSEGANKPLVLSDPTLVKPYLLLRSDRTGKLVSPLPEDQTKPKGARKEEAGLPVEVKNLKIQGGELLYLDGKITRQPHPVRITDIELTADHLAFPGDARPTTYNLTAHLPGRYSTGTLVSSGTTVRKTLDTNARATLRNLDLTSFKPYLVKEGDVDVSRGFLDLDVNLSIRKRMLYAPSHSVLRDLQFVEARGRKDQFLGVPRTLVVDALKTSDNRIEIDFVAEGNIDNPTFSLRENMVTRLTVGLARTLGLSVIETGGQVIIQSGRILKGVGDVMKDLMK